MTHLLLTFQKLKQLNQRVGLCSNLCNSVCNNKGFSLIEVLIASGIFVVVIGVSSMIFTTSTNIQSRTKVLRDTSQSLRYAVEAIARDIRMSSSHTNSDFFTEEETTYPPFEILSDGTGSALADISIDYVASEDKNTDDPPYITYEYKVEKDFYPENLAEGKQDIRTLTVTEFRDGNPVGVPEGMTPRNIDVVNLTFTGTDNWSTTSQPYLTIEMTVKNTQGVKELESLTLKIRTTVTSRNYPGFE